MEALPGKSKRSSKPVSTAKNRQPDLEKSLAELESIVTELEDGDISLEKALKQFEKGIKLSRECQTALQAAEQRVQMLVNDDLEDFATGEAAED